VPGADERLATVEAVLGEIRGDVGEVRSELFRTRERLHKLENIANSFVLAQKENRRKEAAQYQRLGLKIQVLTVVVTIAAILAPIATVLVAGK
jgi:hypothetical protein